MIKEEFRWIKGFEGLYLISNLGRVYSEQRKDSLGRITGGCFKSTRFNKQGYIIISLNKNGVQYTKIVHRLVAETFIPNPENKPEVDHIDADKTNNTVKNLRWATKSENMRNPNTYCNMSGSAKKNPVNGDKNPFSRRVAQYDLDGNFIKEFESTGLASQAIGINASTIGKCALGKRPTCGGFKWKYTSDAKIKAKGLLPKGYNGTQIQQFDLNGNLIATYVSIQEASRITGFNAPNLGRALKGIYKTYKGFVWKKFKD
jgi:hypothetical protein